MGALSAALMALSVALLSLGCEAARLPAPQALGAERARQPQVQQQRQQRPWERRGGGLARGDEGGAAAANARPIIGILSQPGPPAPEGGSYIAASYVKWVEAAGARVIPIFYDETPDQIRFKFNAINGLLLPGGGAKLKPGHPFYDAARLLVEMAIKANDAGDYFPVHGTCLGMETLAIVVSGNYTLLSDMDAEDAPAPLLYTDQAEGSHFFGSLPPSVVRDLQNSPIAMENHMHGVLMTAYEENPALKAFFKVLSLSMDRKGLPYISTMEARKYPITATQFHPEKAQFEWPTFLHIPHSPEAVAMGQEVANFFVREARRNKHATRDQLDEDDMLIYRYKPEFTGRHASGGEEQDFEQTYIFSGPKARAAQQLQREADRAAADAAAAASGRSARSWRAALLRRWLP